MKDGLATIPSYKDWKLRRQLYDPAFKKKYVMHQADRAIYWLFLFLSYLKTLVEVFSETTTEMVNEIKPLADGKTVVPLKKYIRQLTMNIISRVSHI